MIEWLRNPRKQRSQGSTGWNAMMDAYQLIGDWLCWKIGNGRKIRIGEDPWIGGGEAFKLSNILVEELHSKGFFHYGMQNL
jgi:hypothetical protein